MRIVEPAGAPKARTVLHFVTEGSTKKKTQRERSRASRAYLSKAVTVSTFER